MSADALFDDSPFREVPAEEEKITAGEKLRRRQAARISCGMHPLSAVLSPLRLHPDAARPLVNDGERGELRCGAVEVELYRGRVPVSHWGEALADVWPKS